MLKFIMSLLLIYSSIVYAGDFGSREEAKNLLGKATNVMKEYRRRAYSLTLFTFGKGRIQLQRLVRFLQ